MNELSTAEEHQLQKLELVIDGAKESFIECGMALMKIRDGKLYRRDFKSFQAYCQKKWDFDRQHAYRLIGTVDVKVSPMGDKIKNERQARAIAKVPKKDQAAVLEKAEASGEITSTSIEKAANDVADKKKKHFDEEGFPIPDCILEDWGKALAKKDLIKKLSDVRSALRKGLEEKDMFFTELNQHTLAHLDNAYTSYKRILPYAVCTSCSGHKRDKCVLCQHRGFISKHTWERCIPEEVRELRKKMVVAK